MNILKSMIVLALLLVVSALSVANAQQIWPDELKQLQRQALENNPLSKAAELEAQSAKEAIKGVSMLTQTELYYFFDEANIARNDVAIKTFGIQQGFRFPLVYLREKQQREVASSGQQIQSERQQMMLERQVAELWLQRLYTQHQAAIYEELMRFYTQFAEGEKTRYESGESSALRWYNARSRLAELSAQKLAIHEQLSSVERQLQQTTGLSSLRALKMDRLFKLSIPEKENGISPAVALAKNQEAQAKASSALAKAQWLPDLNLELFQGTNAAPNADLYQGIRLGVAIPLAVRSRSAQVKSANLQQQAANAQQQWALQQAEVQKYRIQTEMNRLNALLAAYEEEIAPLNKQAESMAMESYEAGETAYLEFLQTMERIRQAELSYLDHLLAYNQQLVLLTYFDF